MCMFCVEKLCQIDNTLGLVGLGPERGLDEMLQVELHDKHFCYFQKFLPSTLKNIKAVNYSCYLKLVVQHHLWARNTLQNYNFYF